MEVKNFNQYTIRNENDQKYMKNRKTLIIERMNVIKKLENLYKFDYNKPSKKITIETNKNDEIQSSKNLFNPLIKNKNIFLNNSQRKLFSKKDLINPILIDNINSNNIKFDKTNLLKVYVNENIEISKGDIVETTGMGGIFPSGILNTTIDPLVRFCPSIRLAPSTGVRSGV